MLFVSMFLQVTCSAGDSCHTCAAISNMLVLCGIPRYPAPYNGIVRPPVFPPRPPLTQPPIPGIRGVPPIVTPVIRPVVPIVALPEKPQTTVYVGKIAPTVENDFLLSLLQLCGPVKSWKRAQDPSDGTPRGFGFCEFESAEGVLRALRSLSKLNVDGQELVLNVNQATREYLERYVEKKTEREKKLKEDEVEGLTTEEENAPGVEKRDLPKSSTEVSKNEANDSEEKVNTDPQKFGIVTIEDQEADKDALEKLTKMMDERLKNKPLPPPPPAQTSASEVSTKSKDGDTDADPVKTDVIEDKNDEETTSENRPTSELDKVETPSSDKTRSYDRRSREKERERDLKRERERELERYERERERERVRREREREMKFREAERLYKERVKEWESRERDREYHRQHEREREKEKEWTRRREIKDQEDESDDDDTRKRRHRSSTYEERRRKRQREKEEDMGDRVREEEELAEAKRLAIEEKEQREVANNGSEKPTMAGVTLDPEGRENVEERAYESDSGLANNAENLVMRSGSSDESRTETNVVSEMGPSSSAPARKLGFGLVGSGKRTTVPSVFYEEDEEDGDKEKKMRRLVPIDYTTEELRAVQGSGSGSAGAPPNLAAAAAFAKRISNGNSKEERADPEKDRSRRSNDKLSRRERDRDGEESGRGRDNKEKVHDKASESKKLLDAKQLIDMIPKTKEELFSYEINWAVYDKHELHERMRPWISKKITAFLGEEEATLVDYIVSSTKEHVKASQMLELLQSILDDEAEMFVLKMWRMLIFEIKKVESGLSLKPRA
ncbi:RNA-binding motif protein 25-like isoform X2 [Aristolochia californica]|uniref:RNA-binding motif protein 25-like isoform X2 n=1 Tax=Aristolochia californica TaxID=171875 RepID=UPI0035E1E067